MELLPDVEVLFEFSGRRRDNIYEGYRPAHHIKEDYLTTGVHHYYDLSNRSGEMIKGTIAFITPEEYPYCLKVGQKILMYEGKELVGEATIIKIFNLLLEKRSNEYI